MTKEECYELGRITKPHGLKGEVQVLLDVDDPEYYEDMESVFVEQKGELVPYFIESIKVRTNMVIVKFESVDTLETATKLKNAILYLPEDLLDDLDEDDYYFHDLIGCTVIDSEKGELGQVKAVHTMPAQNLLEIEHQGKEVLIPIIDSIVTKVDKEAKKIDVTLPEGLLEVYLAETHNQQEEE
jgi:16S rRNA processing protein RimM